MSFAMESEIFLSYQGTAQVPFISSSNHSDLTIISDYDITNWPVSDRCQSALGEIVDTHVVNPIPAYDINHKLINPNDYTTKLCGALVEVHFAIVHHQIKSTKKSIFNAVLREMIVLRPPIAIIRSPIKRKIGTSPSTMKKAKRA
jgi:hypothetical protein